MASGWIRAPAERRAAVPGIFNFLLGMLLWCYFAVVLTDPGSVPQFWRPVIDEEGVDAQTLPLSDMSSSAGTDLNLEVSIVNGAPQNPRVRFCRKCCNFKPPRCHHCSVCGRCVLKMDHHCVWVAGCVGARNYKFFLLFLLYTFLETTLDTLALLPPFISFFRDIEHHSDSASRISTTFLGFVLNVAFALSLLGFIIMHTSLVLNNTTTIEAYEKKHTTRWKYDLGWRNNFEQVFGTWKMYWFIPIYDEDDLRNMASLQGLDYPIRPELEGQDL